ncbi:hypothetical protein Tco_0809328, partial [Tanacetum coccineum]
TNPSVLVDQTKSTRDGLKTAHTDSDKSKEEETKKDEDTHAISYNIPEDTSVAELKNIQWELPAEFLDLPSQVSSVQGKLKTLDSLPSLLNTVTDTLNRFATMVETASRAVSKNVPSASQATTLPAEGGRTPIQKEVVQACPDRKEKGWKTIYGLINTRMEYLNQTKKELNIDFNKPLKEQDPLNELNDLANKKRKRISDSKEHSRSSKKHKSSVQHEEEVLRRLGSIFTSVYAADQKLKKAYAKSFSSAWLTIPT